MNRDTKGQFSNSSFFKEIKGELHKLCTGPGHDEPTWLPATEKYFHVRHSEYRDGQFVSRCRLCVNWEKLKSPGISGYVSLDIAHPFFLEAVNRVGHEEVARRIGMNPDNLRKILQKQRTYVQKRNLRKLMLELISMRRKGEVRHRDSIRHGSAKRGRSEKAPKNRIDFYSQASDEEAAYRRELRRSRAIT